MKYFFALLLTCFSGMLFAQVNPVQLGRASNLIESNLFPLHGILPQQNMLAAVDSLDLVLFLHRHDITIYGGGSIENGKFRYDFSTDGGNSFSVDAGPVNPVYTLAGRTPQILAYNPAGSQNPLDAKVIWTGSTDMFPTPGNIGLVAGVSNISTTGNVTSTEQYLFNSSPKHVPGGLCAGLPGEFWMAEQVYDGSHFVDTTIVYKGVYNAATGDVDWAIHQKIRIPYDLTRDGNPYSSVPNMAFSPDGMTGYIAFAADLTGGNLPAYQPVFIKSSDAGQSWGLPTELDLNAFPSLSDSLTVNEPGLGIAPELDMSVDVNGNLHLFVHIIGAQDYDPYPYQWGDIPWHGMYDIATSDGGTTWQAWMVAPAYTFEGEFGSPSPSTGDLISMDKQPQMSRTEDGRYLFYSWVDSDTTYIGYGELNNLAPNLRIAGLAVETGLRTPAKRVSDGDLLWEGRVLYPTMAPTVLTPNNRFHLPIVVSDLITNDPLSPISYWYFGHDAFFDFAELGATTAIERPAALRQVKLFPNPIQGPEVHIQGLAGPAQLDLFDLTGRHLSQQTTLGTLGTQSLNVGHLPAGLYGLRITLPDGATATYKLQKQD